MKFRDLDELIGTVECTVAGVLARRGSVPMHALLLLPNGGTLGVDARKFQNTPEARALFVRFLRRAARETGAVGCVVAVECWVSFRPVSEGIPDAPASQDPERKEAVVVDAQSAAGRTVRYCVFGRDAAGRPVPGAWQRVAPLDSIYDGIIPPARPVALN